MSKVCKHVIAESINPSECETNPPKNATWKIQIMNPWKYKSSKYTSNFDVPKTGIPTSAVSRKRSNCLWAETEGIVTSLNVTHALKKLRCFLAHFKAWIAKELLEWTRVSCKKVW